MTHAATHRAIHEAFSRRNFDEVAAKQHPSTEYRDRARQLTANGPAESIDYLKGWTTAFSDAVFADGMYLDGTDHSVSFCTMRGTNDGPFGPFPATGSTVGVPLCEVFHYDADGQVIGADLFYDATAFLVQLGHAEAPPA
ncbi:ester cyclase [Nonomuraea sp. PA05]|uniref:ester cyclase n=1 Tax=Nonomuraea sp. PA05 TaxID=2604466 RepID=UPI0011D8A356|nr:ester cyclase [Nonomuraea sp. PA05]TYB71202.1 ester cyclase [Nonomuraea sp. PA05]